MTTMRPMSCEQLDAMLADWLEQDLARDDAARVEQHLAQCARCTALVADLTSIQRQAAALPPLVPSRDLWPGIDARIQTPVIALPAKQDAPRRRHWWMGAAAAALVAVTASVTWLATSPGPNATTPVVASSDTAPSPAAQHTVTSSDSSDEMPAVPDASLARSDEPRGGASRAPAASARTGAPSADPAGDTQYARDVADLRALVRERRAELDSSTVAVLERNLELIDKAIAESREALSRDPASEFLADELTRAMTKKLAILRTVALLPARS